MIFDHSLEIIVSGDILTWIRLLFWLKLRSTDAWPWLSVKTKATTDASFLNLETPRVSEYSSSKRSSLGNSINFSLNSMTLLSRNSLNSDTASSQHFLDRMFKLKIRVRTIFHLSRTEDVEQKEVGENQNPKGFFNKFGNHSNNKLLTFLLEFGYLGFWNKIGWHQAILAFWKSYW